MESCAKLNNYAILSFIVHLAYGIISQAVSFLLILEEDINSGALYMLRKLLFASTICAMPAAVLAQEQPAEEAQAAPESLLPPTPTTDAMTADEPVAVEPEIVEEVRPLWSAEAATQLLGKINDIGADGLKPADYQPAKLKAALDSGDAAQIDAEATRAFTWLAEDIRDGRTPQKSRIQWFVVDPDAQAMPTAGLLAKVLDGGDVNAILKSLEPTHDDYAALRKQLAATPAASVTKRRLITANMDRWRWLQRDLGKDYLFTNVPEYMVQYVINDTQIATFRTIVGKPGRNATPQLTEMVRGVIYNPTWTVPQSIVKGEGLGARVLGNPAWAKSKGYTATKGANGYVSVVQKSGPGNALGYMKLDMPNRHAIFLHDTPSRRLFRNANRALSHGCIRTENAADLAMAIAYVQGDVPTARSNRIMKSRKYTNVPVKRKLPVYITYFTMASDVNGKMKSFRDIYGRDKAVFNSFAKPRKRQPASVASK